MTVTYFDVRNWARSYMDGGSNVQKFKHMARRHWDMSDEDLAGRVRATGKPASSFRGITVEWFVNEILPKVFGDEESLLRIMRWVNDPKSRDSMAFFVNAGRDVGVSMDLNETTEPCHMVVFWLRKDGTLLPHLATIYPVPDGYTVKQEYLSGQYKTPKAKKGS